VDFDVSDTQFRPGWFEGRSNGELSRIRFQANNYRHSKSTRHDEHGHLRSIGRQAQVRPKGQDPENQLRELRAWAVNSGHAIDGEYVDYESGRKGAGRRKQFAALFDDAAKRKFDCVLFWALDRFSREGMAQTILYLQRLSSYGVAFHSYSEPHLATDNELVRNILLALLSSLAKVEAQKISERTKAGVARARAKGVRIGRPKLGLDLRQKIAQRAAKGETPYAIAKARSQIHTLINGT
jgi:DNA invertase Pin-like site-specific DNA recombinase